MKIKFLRLLFVFTISLLILGCVNANTINERFTEAGYTHSEDASTWISSLLAEMQREGVEVTAHVYTNGLRVAIVLEFETTKELRKQIDESETLQSLIVDLEESKLIIGNFLLIPVIAFTTDARNEMIDVFNGDYKIPSK